MVKKKHPKKSKAKVQQHTKSSASQKTQKQSRRPKSVQSRKSGHSRVQTAGKSFDQWFEEVLGNKAPYLLLLLLAVISLIIFHDFIMLDKVLLFKDIGSDTITSFYPAMLHKHHLINEDGFYHSWSFYQGMGSNVYSGQDLLNPLYYIDVLLIRLIPSGAMIYRVFYWQLFYVIASGMAFYFYSRTIGLQRYAGVVGGLLYAFCGYMMLGLTWWNYPPFAFKMILLLWGFELLLRKKMWLVFPFFICFSGGLRTSFYFFALFLMVYGTVRFFDEYGWKVKQFAFFGLKIIGLTLFGFALQASIIPSQMVLVPLMPRFFGNSASYTDQLSNLPVFALDDSIWNQVLVQGKFLYIEGNHYITAIMSFFSKDILGTGSFFKGWYNYLESPTFYAGLFTLMLVPQVFVFFNRRQRILYGSLLFLWLLAVIFPYFRHAINLFLGNYYKVSLSIFLPLTLIIMGVYALNFIDKLKKINWIVLSATFVLLSVLLFFPYYHVENGLINNSLRTSAFVFLLVYTALLFALDRKVDKRLVQLAVLLVLVVELSYFGYYPANHRYMAPSVENNFSTEQPAIVTADELKQKKGFNDYTVEAVAYLDSIDQSFYRVEKDYQSGVAMHGSLNDAQAQMYYGTASYSSMNQYYYLEFLSRTNVIDINNETQTRWARGLKGYPLLQTFGNVKYHLSKDAQPRFRSFGFDSLARFGDVMVLKNRYYLPLGYTYDRYFPADKYDSLYAITLNETNWLSLKDSLPNDLLMAIKPFVGQSFPADGQLFEQNLVQAIGETATAQYKDKIMANMRRQSSLAQQLILLNAFVIDDSVQTQLSKDFEALTSADTSVFIPGDQFTFDYYESYVSALREDSLNITQFESDHIIGEIELDKRKMLFFSIPYYPGWSAVVNGQPADIQVVNFGFMGLNLDAGKHSVELIYTPLGYYEALTVQLIAIVVYLLLIAWYIIHKRTNLFKRKNTSPNS